MAPPRITTDGQGSGPTSQRPNVPPAPRPETTVSGGTPANPARPGTVTVQDGGHSTSTPTYTGTLATSQGYPSRWDAQGNVTGYAYSSPRPSAAYETTLIDSYNLPSGVSNPYMDEDYRDYLDKVAKLLGTANSTGGALWQRAIDASQAAAQNGQQISPYSIIQQWVADANADGSNGPGGGGSSGSGGGGGGGGSAGTPPVVSMMNRADVNTLANSIAQEMLGRGVTESELDRIMKRVRRVERNNPRTVSVGANGATVVRDGASQATREQVIQRVLAKNPEYEPFQKATTLMDWFNNALQERMAASG